MQNETFKEWHSNPTFGICRLSLLSVYEKPVSDAGLSTQILFGELYEVIVVSDDGQWLKIEGLEFIGSGWILASQHHPLTKEAFEFFAKSPRQIVSQGIGEIKLKDATMFLLPGSQLHAGQNEIFEWEDSIKFKGNSRSYEKKANRQEIKKIGLSFLHAPYLSGGRSIFGLNGSSWINLLFKIGGIVFPNELGSLGHIEGRQDVSEIDVGDVIIFGTQSGMPFQVGLFIGEGTLLWVKEKVKFGAFDPEKWSTTNNRFKNSVQLLTVKKLVD